MNKEQQRIAIAEACGWKRISIPLAGPRWIPSTHLEGYHRLSDSMPLPDYLNDLNAMHEAEKANMDCLDGQYYATLERISFEARGLGCANGSLSIGFSGWIAHATAEQRAEAFLRATGKWVEG